MALGPVRVMGAGVIVMMCVEEVCIKSCELYRLCNQYTGLVIGTKYTCSRVAAYAHMQLAILLLFVFT